MSLLPEELARLIGGSRRIWAALGSGERRPVPSEGTLRSAIRRSLVLRGDVGAGHVITLENLTAVRPGMGIPANESDRVVGRQAKAPLKALTALRWSDLKE